MGLKNAANRTAHIEESAIASQGSSVFAVTRDALDRHGLLRGHLQKAAELAGLAVIEQKPPLCRVLLPLHRLFQEFGSELESYIELEETALIPNLLAYIGGRVPTQDLTETVRLLRHGQDTLVLLLSDMCELTEGFLTPTESCHSYMELLVVLRAIQTELVCEFCLERDVLFPQALSYAEGFDGLSRRQVC